MGGSHSRSRVFGSDRLQSSRTSRTPKRSPTKFFFVLYKRTLKSVANASLSPGQRVEVSKVGLAERAETEHSEERVVDDTVHVQVETQLAAQERSQDRDVEGCVDGGVVAATPRGKLLRQVRQLSRESERGRRNNSKGFLTVCVQQSIAEFFCVGCAAHGQGDTRGAGVGTDGVGWGQ